MIQLGCRWPGLQVGPEEHPGGHLGGSTGYQGISLGLGSVEQGARDKIPGEPGGRSERHTLRCEPRSEARRFRNLNPRAGSGKVEAESGARRMRDSSEREVCQSRLRLVSGYAYLYPLWSHLTGYKTQGDKGSVYSFPYFEVFFWPDQ